MGNEQSSQGGALVAAQFAGDKLWDPSWKESSGEVTIKKHMAEHGRKFYCSWFCPFAQRVWISLEEAGLHYQYVEVNPYDVDPKQPGGYTKKALRLLDKKESMPDFVKVSPRGLVPAICDTDGTAVWESAIAVEYLCEKYPNQVKLMPTDPAKRVLVRALIDHCTNRIQKAYYKWLMAQDEETQTAARTTFIDECRALAAAMAPNGAAVHFDVPHDDDDTKVDAQALHRLGKKLLNKDGPYILGSEFSAADVALAPFWQRIHWVGSHFRGIDLEAMARNDPAFARLEAWWDAVKARPSVKATFVCRKRLLSSYSDYAKNVATSDVAVSIQSEGKR